MVAQYTVRGFCANRAPERHFDSSSRNYFPYLHALRVFREKSLITGLSLSPALGVAKGLRRPYVRHHYAKHVLLFARVARTIPDAIRTKGLATILTEENTGEELQ